MEITLLSHKKQAEQMEQILPLLAVADKEFVPPLSARTSTTQQTLLCDKSLAGVTLYWEEMKQQRLLVAKEQEEIVGFVSFKENFTSEEIKDNTLPNLYITTVIVSPSFRGKGLTQAMYQHLFSLYEYTNVFTRTWSTNTAHLKILSRFGFMPILTLKNHRGQGIDTLYFQKQP